MISVFELHIAKARDVSWHFLCKGMSVHVVDVFKQNGNKPLDAARARLLERLRLMWRNVCNTYAKITAASSQHYAAAIASATVSSQLYAPVISVPSLIAVVVRLA